MKGQLKVSFTIVEARMAKAFNVQYWFFATNKLLLGTRESQERRVGVAKLRRGRGKPYLIRDFFADSDCDGNL